MEHPFIGSLEDKTMEEIDKTLAKLRGQQTYAYRSGNQSLIHQVNMMIESYQNEYNKKLSAIMDKQNISSKIKIQPK